MSTVTITTTDGVTHVYPIGTVKSCSCFAIATEGSNFEVPVSSEEFSLMDKYLNSVPLDSFITKESLKMIVSGMKYTLEIAPESFIDEVRNCMSEIVYRTMVEEMKTSTSPLGETKKIISELIGC